MKEIMWGCGGLLVVVVVVGVCWKRKKAKQIAKVMGIGEKHFRCRGKTKRITDVPNSESALNFLVFVDLSFLR